jgi:hypothetical protein
MFGVFCQLFFSSLTKQNHDVCFFSNSARSLAMAARITAKQPPECEKREKKGKFSVRIQPSRGDYHRTRFPRSTFTSKILLSPFLFSSFIKIGKLKGQLFFQISPKSWAVIIWLNENFSAKKKSFKRVSSYSDFETRVSILEDIE